MVGMLGSRGVDNTLTGLVNIVSDPAKYKKSMADLKTATDKHRAEREAAAKQKAEAEKTIAKVNERLAYLEDIDAKIAQAQKQFNDARNALASKQAAHDQRVNDFNAGMAAERADFSLRTNAERKELAAAKAEFEQAKKNHTENVDKAVAVIKEKRAEIDRTNARLLAKSRQLDAREADVAKLEADVRSRVEKINALFPIG